MHKLRHYLFKSQREALNRKDSKGSPGTMKNLCVPLCLSLCVCSLWEMGVEALPQPL